MAGTLDGAGRAPDRDGGPGSDQQRAGAEAAVAGDSGSCHDSP